MEMYDTKGHLMLKHININRTW